MKKILLSIVVMFGAGIQANADTINNAYALCKTFDDTGVLAKPCEVSGWGQSVDIPVAISSTEARAICAMYADRAKEVGMKFDEGWTIKIYSPYSGENTIAVCKLPN